MPKPTCVAVPPNVKRDLAGQRFGKLTAKSYLGKRRWLCICDCGKEVNIRHDHLLRMETQSCGCASAAEDLKGKKFGEWTVAERAGSLQTGSPLWRCSCSCGTEAIHQGSNLRSGSTKSCGCVPIFDDLTQRKFNRLTPVFRTDDEPPKWVCKCDCGGYRTSLASNLTGGRTQSCGCLLLENARFVSRYVTTHGKSRSRVYRIYRGMLSRCLNPKAFGYKKYGAAGIIVCERWRECFENFYEDMGDPPSDDHTLDRKRNSDGYSPDNCRWATKKEQARNKSTCQYLTHKGVTACYSEWAELLGLPAQTIG